MKIKLLRSYRGWASDERVIQEGAVVDHPNSYAVYLIKQGWAEKVEKKLALEDMDYRELQSLCMERDLKASGTTEELIERLQND